MMGLNTYPDIQQAFDELTAEKVGIKFTASAD
jgi:hypothetical protein